MLSTATTTIVLAAAVALGGSVLSTAALARGMGGYGGGFGGGHFGGHYGGFHGGYGHGGFHHGFGGYGAYGYSPAYDCNYPNRSRYRNCY